MVFLAGALQLAAGPRRCWFCDAARQPLCHIGWALARARVWLFHQGAVLFVLAEAAACWAALQLPKLFESSAASVRQGLALWCSSGAAGSSQGHDRVFCYRMYGEMHVFCHCRHCAKARRLLVDRARFLLVNKNSRISQGFGWFF